MTWSPQILHPVFATRVLCDVANEYGLGQRDLLAGTGIDPADLHDPTGLVAAGDEVVLVRQLLAQLPDHTRLGVEVGSRFSLTHLGLLGFAVMSCATLRELVTIAMRYFTLTMLHIDVKLFEGAEDCVLELNVDHLPSDVRRFFIGRDIAGIIATISGLVYEVVHRYADRVVVELSVAEDDLRPLLAMVPVENIAFGRAHTRLHLPRALLDEPMPQADRHTFDACIAQCELLMQRKTQRRGITALVRMKLVGDPGRFPTLPLVAAELNLHPRTLRRQLAAEGTSFRVLLTEARSALAVDLLRNVGLTVDEVAKRLGYNDAAAFSNAFKRWHGMAPSRFRLDSHNLPEQ
jgi:AraC-like DNA-binding protein